MKSIITGKEIPETEWWVWSLHLNHWNYDRRGRPTLMDHREVWDATIPYERHSPTCGRCGEDVYELFAFMSLLSHGYHQYCHDCMMKVAEFFDSKSCPVCGFGFGGSGGGINHCPWGHEWKETHPVKKHVTKSILEDE